MHIPKHVPWCQGNRCRHAHGNKELRSFRPEVPWSTNQRFSQVVEASFGRQIRDVIGDVDGMCLDSVDLDVDGS